MLKLVLSDAVLFKKSVDAVAVLIDEAEFVIKDEGVFLKATDPSQISMVDFFLPKSAFKEFNCGSEQRLGVDLDYLSQVLSRAKAGDSLELEVDDSNSKLLVFFSGKAKRKFEVPLIDVNSRDLPNPKISFDAELRVKSEALHDALKDASLISTHIILGVDGEGFFLEARSSKGSMKNEIHSSEKDLLLEFKARENVRSMFPLDYLSDIVKGAPGDAEISLKLKSSAPAEISYTVGGASLKYFLAPRIESE